METWAGMALLAVLGFVLGFALNHGSICTVIATTELISEKRPARFIALFEAAVWAALVYAILETSPTMQQGWLPLGYLIPAAMLFGIGSYVNGACVLGSVGHFGNRLGIKSNPSGKVGKLSEEAKALLNEANGASETARNAWLAFLALLTYLLVTLASVSHKDLLLNSPVKLPIVNVDIPLFSFFQYAPALLLLVYLSLLMQHVILARKYRKFTEAISPYESEAQRKHPARELVHSYLVSQILAGPRPNPIRNWLTQLMVWVTFIVLPVLTLLYFQIKFLPYHEIWITYWHRIAVILSFAMPIPETLPG